MTGFTAFPKIPRLFKDVVISEKIDGTNAGIRIVRDALSSVEPLADGKFKDAAGHFIWAQSRNRDITPDDDNHGFAAWVWEHADKLVETLGEGMHFGEWWGSGINRGYGLTNGDKRFSLFNRSRWGHFDDPNQLPDIPGIGVVPELYNGDMDTMAAQATMQALQMVGSYAAPGFMNPEGIVIFHTAGNHLYKVTFGGDAAKALALEKPKPQLVLAA